MDTISKKDLGKVLITVGGDYNPEQAYEKLTLVVYQGVVYLSKIDVPSGISPTGDKNDNYWFNYQLDNASVIVGRAYRRLNAFNLAAPTGGSFDNPHPVEDEWLPNIPNGNAILWVSQRMFTSNGKNQDAVWSTPAQLTYTLYTEYYTSVNELKPENPDIAPESWVKGYQDNYNWLATQEVYNGSKNGWSIIRAVGTTIKKATAEINEEVGIPEVELVVTGNEVNKNYHFKFKNLKGIQGEQGIQGIQGIQGEQGIQGKQGIQGEKGEVGDNGSSTYPFNGIIDKNGNNNISFIIKPIEEAIEIGDNVIDKNGDVYNINAITETSFTVNKNDYINIKGIDIKRTIVFKRTNAVVSVSPTGGDYSNPVPIEEDWSTTIPDGAAKLWVSIRMFTSNGVNQDNTWSIPTAITYVQYIEIKYSNIEDNPGNPDSNPDNWKDNLTDYVYVAIRQIYNGTKQIWNVSRVKGIKGEIGQAGKDGIDGKNLTVIGYKDTLEQLETDVPNPEQGDAYAVGTTEPYDLYIYDNVRKWVNNGSIGGAQPDIVYEPAVDDATKTTEKVGGIASGITAAQLRGKSFSTLFDDMLFPVVYPTFVNPSASISLKSTFTNIQEIGSTNVPKAISDFNVSYNAGSIMLNGIKQNDRGGTKVENSDEIWVNNVEGAPYPTMVNNGVTSYAYSCNYAEGPQPKDNKGNNYQTPLPAGIAKSSTVTITGVYPYWANKININSFYKLPLTTSRTLNIDYPSESASYKHAFKIPDIYSVTNITLLNTLSGKYENYPIDKFTVTKQNMTVQGNSISYKVYTRNDGINGDSTFNITF